jgi:integral membrane protein (TIGR01906 family)
MKKEVMKKIGKIFLIINISLFIISSSISFVILFRPFYYYHINSLNLVEETGYTYNEIKEAYDDVLDYTTKNKPFSTGKLKYSEEGKSHFRDCKILFTINFIVFGISGIIIIIKKKFWNNLKVFKRNLGFWSSCFILLFFTIIVLTTLIIGFDKSFETFHNIFFLGKDNWILEYDTDEIINILPIEYFLHCAILAISIIGTISFGLIIKEIIDSKKTSLNN